MPATRTSSSTVLPYIKAVSEAVRQILAPIHVKTNFRPAHTLRKVLVCAKDSIPPEKRPGVVYHIPCSACPKAYLHQTSRSLMQCVKGHRRALATGNCLPSAAAEHAMTTTHAIDWDRATVIDHAPSPHHTMMLPGVFIAQPEHLNRELPYQLYTVPFSPYLKR